MIYIELGYGMPNKEVDISKDIKSMATLNLPTIIQYEIAMLYLDMEKITTIHNDIIEQYNVIDAFVKVITRTISDAIVHNGIGNKYVDYITELFLASIDPYINKECLYCYMNNEMVCNVDIDKIKSLIAELMDNIISILITLDIENTYDIPCAFDIANDVGRTDYYNGWLVHKTLGTNILVLLKL